MHVNKETLAALEFVRPYLERFPAKVDIDFSVSFAGEVPAPKVVIQAHTQDEVRTIRGLFGFTVWVKTWNPSLQWLEYTTSLAGVDIEIYAVREAPQACQIVEEEVEVEEQVPTAFETQLVKRTVRRMVCPDVA